MLFVMYSSKLGDYRGNCKESISLLPPDLLVPVRLQFKIVKTFVFNPDLSTTICLYICSFFLATIVFQIVKKIQLLKQSFWVPSSLLKP